MVDDQARRTLLEGANRFAIGRLRSFLAAPDAPNAASALADAGSAFGALGSRPYSVAATLDLQKMATSTAKDLVGAVRGAALSVVKAQPVVSLAIEGGSAILFDAGQAVADQQRAIHDLMMQQTAAEQLNSLRGDLSNNLKHLTYVSVLTDPAQRAALDLHLSPSDLPAELPRNLNLNVTTRQEWLRDLFDDQGRLTVPQPSDVGRWKSFLRWSETVNPRLEDRVRELTNPMFDAFDRTARP
jgi:hypothetical protein